MTDTVNSVVRSWASSTAYAVRDVVVNAGSYYRCNTAHTSGGTFAGDSSKWDALGFTPTGTIYSSLSSWDSARAAAVGSGNREIVECYAGRDTNRYQASASWDGSAGDIVVSVPASDRQIGAFGSGFRIDYNGSYQSLAIFYGGPHWVLDGLAVKQGSSATSGYDLFYFSNAGLYVKEITNCFFVSENNNSGASIGFLGIGGGNSCVLVNSIFLHLGSTSTVALSFYTGLTRAYNCLFIAPNGVALRADYLDNGSLVKNCYMHGSTAYQDTYSQNYIAFTTSKHSTSQSITGSTGNTAYDTSNFTNVTSGSEDLSLPSGSALIDAGTDLSGDAYYPFSTDILGATRSGTWEVGPFNYAAPSGGPAPKCWWDEELELAA